MGRPPLDPGFSAKLELRFRRLQLDYRLTDEDALTLGAQARRILDSRVRPAISPADPSISPENWCEGIWPILDATIRQACLDAARVWKIRLVSKA